MKLISGIGLFLLLGIAGIITPIKAVAQQSDSTSVLRADDARRVNSYLAVMKSAGITLDTSMPLQTRPEFAAAIQRWLKQHQQSEQDFDTDTTRELKQHPEAADAFRRLISEFTPELMTLGVNTFSIKYSLVGFVSTLFRDEASLPSPSGLGLDPTDLFPDQHWIFRAIDSEFKAGIVIGFPRGNPGTFAGAYRSSYPTGQELAEVFIRLLPLLDSVGSSVPVEIRNKNSTESSGQLQNNIDNFRIEVQTRLKQHPGAISSLLRIVTELSPELKSLGQDTAHAKAQLDSLALQSHAVPEPFKNVPRGHWAEPSVEALRKAGILIGYPDGRFWLSGPG